MFDVSELATALPELFILGMASVILIVDLLISEQRRVMIYVMSIATLVFATILTLGPHGAPLDGNAIYVFQSTFVRDPVSDLLKVFTYLVMGIVFVYSKDYLIERNLFRGEFFVLALLGMLGMMIIISSANLISIYLGIELLALSSYALVAMNRDSVTSSEAAMKYFVLGAIASGMLLYGMSLIYGITGTLDLQQISINSAAIGNENMILTFGIAFLVVGLAFKLGAVPFHMWVPDVYEGAPTAISLYIGSVPKMAAFALAYRLLENGLGELHGQWQQMLVVLSALSIVLGNVVAIAQTNFKRMLAYSTISHIGFILLGFLSGTQQGYAAAMYYTIVYSIMAAGAFGMVILLSQKGFDCDKLDDFKGLNQRSPWFAFIMLLIMASMAGIPPLIGFHAKLYVLQAAINADMIGLAILAVLFSVVGAFYYLRIIKLMYFDELEHDSEINAPHDIGALLSLNGLAQLALGIVPAPLISACIAAIAQST